MKKIVVALFVFFLWVANAPAQKTYCNPVDLDYGFTPIPNFSD
ncbi:MAG: hypothetical protein SH848_11395 [Saprospiraceae bacterium]|nr:hypothetical protein [Saprospiraceae bacterium]MDZ4704527.1 hypothetical protein [Saprospiraceae bacterium]